MPALVYLGYAMIGSGTVVLVTKVLLDTGIITR
jgi:hypothetical protein